MTKKLLSLALAAILLMTLEEAGIDVSFHPRRAG